MSEIIIGLITSKYLEAFPHCVLVEAPSVKQHSYLSIRGQSMQLINQSCHPVLCFLPRIGSRGSLSRTIKQHLLLRSSITSSKAMNFLKYRNHSNSSRPEPQDRQSDFLMSKVRAPHKELCLLHHEITLGTNDSALFVLNNLEVTRSPRQDNAALCPASDKQGH